jgi:predicted MFS family arabinose efflux permease
LVSSQQELTPPQAGSSPFPWRFTAPLFVGSALNPINSSLIATALVPIAAAVHVSVGQTAALVSALYLAAAIAQPTAGKLAEVFGPRRIFLAGIVGVLAGGLVGGFARTLLVLVVSRVLIGVGTSCAYPTAMLLIRRRATQAGLAKPPGGVLGGLQIAGVATASLGLPLGGVLVQFAGWRSVFFINVPVALIALVATLRWIPRDEPAPRQSARQVLTALDVTGIAGFALAMTGLLLFLSALPRLNWLLLGLTIALWAAELAWELRAEKPFFDLRLLARNAALTRTYLRYFLVMLCSYVVLYGISEWVEASRGYSELDTGLLLLPMTVVSGLVITPIARRNLIRGPILWCAVSCLAGGVAALFLPGGSWLAVIIVVTLLLGFAQGAASSNQLALYGQAPPEVLGTASGLMRSFGYFGSIASSAVTGIVFRSQVSDSGVTVIACIMIGASVILLALSALDRTLRRTASD